MSKELIIIGGGSSVKEGLAKGLWDAIKHKTVYAINYCFKEMPYFPDIIFFQNDSILKKHYRELFYISDYCPIIARKRDDDLFSKTMFIQEVEHTENWEEYLNSRRKLYSGNIGLTGIFALSWALREEKWEEIYLLGYDFGTPDIEDRDTHWYKGLNDAEGHSELYWNGKNKIREEIKDFDVFKDIVKPKIYNVSMKSNIEVFEKINYDTFLNRMRGEEVGGR